MTTAVHLGPFELGERIGEGGMGVVYRGRHRTTGVEVAVKVIDRAIEEESRQEFHREVQAHAGLVHPGIVYLFEYGDVPEQAEGASARGLVAGSPFVAMELAGGGTVRGHLPLRDWASVHGILVQVLDALAHAHARGVIHRDLKPENLLVFEGEDDRSRIKLADFGIAHAVPDEGARDTERLTSASGTPYYMAPEQTHGRWRQFGPWTDLYALGCITWELVCGAPPFTGDNPVETMLMHTDAPRPPLTPQFPVPEGLEAWIRRAMAVDPGRRFGRAADARRELDRLATAIQPTTGEPSEDPMATATTREAGEADGEIEPTVQMETTPAPTREEPLGPTLDLDIDAPSEVPGPSSTVGESEPGRARCIPSSWRRTQTGSMPSLLIGTGLGLFGLRETPFVDRDPERDRIWEALREVERTGEPRVVLVVGESGAGKSRLVDWTATRAHELAAANLMRAVHTGGAASPGEGIPGMVKRRVRGHKLDRGEFYEYLLEMLPPLEETETDRETDARGLTELVHPTDDAAEVDGPRYRFTSTGQKCGLVGRLIRRYSAPRPGLVWLDDAQWGEFAMSLVTHLLKSAAERPAALVAVTLRSDVLAERANLAEHVENLSAHEWCTRLDLAPLETDDHRQFVERLLPLEAELAAEVAERTEGNPLFARQLLGNLIEREHLEAGKAGFRLPARETLDLPDDIHELWIRRLTRLIDDLAGTDPEAVWRALERAAALGREVDAREWAAICEGLARGVSDAIDDALIERGLAERTDQGWAFAHALLVDALERHGREHDRWKRHHRRCAELLVELYPDRPGRTAARRANHRLEAGDYEAAIAPLFEEFQRRRRLGDPSKGRRILERRERVMDAVEVPETDPRRLENDLEVVRCQLGLGDDPGEILGNIEEILEQIQRLGNDRLLARTRMLQGRVERALGRFDEAHEYMERAATAARRAPGHTELMEALNDGGWLAAISGDLTAARQKFTELRQLSREHDDGWWEMFAQQGLAYVLVDSDQRGRGVEMLEETLEEARTTGEQSLEASCLNNLAELLRFEGEIDRAREAYQRYRALVREMGRRPDEALAYLNLAQVELKAGRVEQADRHRREAERRFRESTRLEERRHLIEAIRVACAAGRGDWEEFRARLEAYVDARREGVKLEKDQPWLLEIAGDYANEAGEAEHAERAWRLARRHWAKLAPGEGAERVAAKLES